jgi:hypothetical protein
MIPDEAVELASKSAYGLPMSEARKALEAVAPLIAAEVLRLAAHSLERQPPQLQEQYVATLRLYAEEPWRLAYEPTP